MRCRSVLHHLVLLHSSMTMCAAQSTSSRRERAHAESAPDGKTSGHAVMGHGRSCEGTGSGSIGERAELPGTTLAAGGSTMELAREPITGAKTESSQAAGIGLYGGHRLPLGAWPGQSRDAGSGQRIRVGP